MNIPDYIPILDFETKDSYISKDLGAGWIYNFKYDFNADAKDLDFKVLGYSTGLLDVKNKKVIDVEYRDVSFFSEENLWPLRNIVKDYKCFIAHNATYELGCLLHTAMKEEDMKELIVYDTLIIARLYDTRLNSYSLDNLSKLYLLEKFQKNNDVLIDKAIELKLIKEPKKKGYNIERFRKLVEKWCKTNMGILQEKCFNEVADYAMRDVLATGHLFLHMVDL